MACRQVAYNSNAVDSYNSKIDLRSRVRGEKKKRIIAIARKGYVVGVVQSRSAVSIEAQVIASEASIHSCILHCSIQLNSCVPYSHHSRPLRYAFQIQSIPGTKEGQISYGLETPSFSEDEGKVLAECTVYKGCCGCWSAGSSHGPDKVEEVLARHPPCDRQGDRADVDAGWLVA